MYSVLLIIINQFPIPSILEKTYRIKWLNFLSSILRIICSFASFFLLYVVKRNCTTANVVIYAVISFFYTQKFFCWLNFALLFLLSF